MQASELRGRRGRRLATAPRDSRSSGTPLTHNTAYRALQAPTRGETPGVARPRGRQNRRAHAPAHRSWRSVYSYADHHLINSSTHHLINQISMSLLYKKRTKRLVFCSPSSGLQLTLDPRPGQSATRTKPIVHPVRGRVSTTSLQTGRHRAREQPSAFGARHQRV